ncbi:hypothetical protein OTU49_003397, partial [Cherax quadricarinatus]
MKGKSVHNCISTFLTAHTSTGFTTFLDLKSAFDIANRTVILHELAKINIGGSLLRWIIGYLSNRVSSVLYQGFRSESKEMSLGTPQGGVLSPMLFNVLINALLNALPASPKHIAISYADDIMIHTTGHKKMSTILNEVQAICNRLSL